MRSVTDRPPATTPRQHLSTRQAATVDALVAAGLDQLRAVGYDDLTLRSVATAAGVTHTTAYVYFSSKDHLVAEIFWRALQRLPEPDTDLDAPTVERMVAALEGLTRLFIDEPALAHGLVVALLTSDPDVGRIRDQVAADLLARLGTALGPEGDPGVVQAVLLCFIGAMIEARMGYLDFEAALAQVGAVTRLVTR